MAITATMRPIRNPETRRRSTRPVRWLRRHERVVLGTVGVVSLLLIWEIGSRLGLIENFFFSRPTSIVAAGIREVQVPRFWNDVRVSGFEFATGYVSAVVLAIPIGLIFGWYRRVSYMADPWLNLLNSLPRVALLPLIALWIGIGIESKIAVVFLGAFFSVVIPTVQGVRTVDRRFLDVAHSFGASQRRLFTSVVLPGTVPFVVTGLRLGIGRGLIGVVVGELYAQTDGLGVIISRASSNLQPDRMFFAILIFTFTGIVGVESLRRVERYFQRWRPAREER
ncbi:MAG: NitT/TauT family transport system permease protein [Solirubrobacterales bacterium]|nr:NitT/TauT family transport system permease protein [Solirubrobacterales bacterium]